MLKLKKKSIFRIVNIFLILIECILWKDDISNRQKHIIEVYLKHVVVQIKSVLALFNFGPIRILIWTSLYTC